MAVTEECDKRSVVELAQSGFDGTGSSGDRVGESVKRGLDGVTAEVEVPAEQRKGHGDAVDIDEAFAQSVPVLRDR